MSFSYINPDTNLKEEFRTPFFVNTEEFKRTAQYFDKHNAYPPLEDTDFWDEEEDRILNGYSVGGVHITGSHYFYLNFNQIKLTRVKNTEIVVKDQLAKRRVGNKLFMFPDFWDGDYDFFHATRISKGFGLDLVVGKSRQRGYTFKLSSRAVRRYKFIANSVTLLLASQSKFLFDKGDAIGNYVWSGVNFINKNTKWSRQKLITQKDYIKEGYRYRMPNGVEVEAGFLSEIIALTAGAEAGVTRGKTGADAYYEECGVFPNLLEVKAATDPLTLDGDYKTGQQIFFGTGGGKDSRWEAFEELVYNPRGYGCLEIINDWDDDAGNSTCGFFHPVYLNKKGYIDKDGNSDIEGAKASELEIRKEKELAGKNNLVRYSMENPFMPKEAFKRSNRNRFPVAEAEKQLQRLISGLMTDDGIAIELERQEGVLVQKRVSGRLVDSYPIGDYEDTTPVIWQYEKPHTSGGKVPPNLYIICYDPVRFDEGSSIAAAYVLMQPNNIVATGGDYIVASFIGRDESLDSYHKTLFELAEYYNAQIGVENDVGTVVTDYAKRFRKTHLVAQQFQLAHDVRLASLPKGRRGFGMSMASGKEDLKKIYGDNYIKDWLLTERTILGDGKIILNLHLIKDKGLLKEIIKYNNTGNFDRISALRIGMYHLRELIYDGRTAKKDVHKGIRTLLNTKFYG